ncbi:STAS domain-containing protein [Paenibacillus sp. MBLB4367]|uniref:STAS domain-containing protein n=1 Tax=Paenibacillus sp. MBLB4367 TaxID=3384767 RepID=UPI0039083BED
MRVEERAIGDAIVMTLQGRLDPNTSGTLEKAFGKFVEQGKKSFVFAMSELEYVSSAGLRSLLLAAKKMKAIGGKLALCQLTEQVQEVFDMSGFSSIFAIYGSEEEALQAVAV